MLTSQRVLTGWFVATVADFDYFLCPPRAVPSRGGDVTGYVFDINQPTPGSLPTPFDSVLCLLLSLWPYQLYFIYKFSRLHHVFSLFSSGLISALLVLSTICLFYFLFIIFLYESLLEFRYNP